MAGLADNSGGVAFVNHHERVIFLGQLADPVHRSHVAVHREDSVRADDAEPLGLGLLEAALKVGHVRVGVAVADSLAQTHAVDDRSVVQRGGDDRVLCREKRLEHTAVGIEARGVEDGILGVEEIGNRRLQLLVEILGSADETY